MIPPSVPVIFLHQISSHPIHNLATLALSIHTFLPPSHRFLFKGIKKYVTHQLASHQLVSHHPSLRRQPFPLSWANLQQQPLSNSHHSSFQPQPSDFQPFPCGTSPSSDCAKYHQPKGTHPIFKSTINPTLEVLPLSYQLHNPS